MNVPYFIALALLALVFAFGLFILFYKKKHLEEKHIKKIQMHWKDIERLKEESAVQSIWQADKLLDFALEKSGFSGSLGEKLKKASSVFSDLDGVWSAHKLRNRMAHEMDHRAKAFEVKFALRMYKKALSDLGVPL